MSEQTNKPAPLSDAIKKAVAAVREALTYAIANKYIRGKVESLISACTAELQQARRRITEQDERVSWLETQRQVECEQKENALKESGRCLNELDRAQRERDEAQAACAAKDDALRIGIGQVCSVEPWRNKVNAERTMEDALALDCGKGWRSPEEWQALEAKLHEREENIAGWKANAVALAKERDNWQSNAENTLAKLCEARAGWKDSEDRRERDSYKLDELEGRLRVNPTRDKPPTISGTYLALDCITHRWETHYWDNDIEKGWIGMVPIDRGKRFTHWIAEPTLP